MQEQPKCFKKFLLQAPNLRFSMVFLSRTHPLLSLTFFLLSSVSPAPKNPQLSWFQNAQKSLLFSLPSLFKPLTFPSLQDTNHSHTPLGAHQPPLFPPLCPPLSNLNVGVGWWKWVWLPMQTAFKAVCRPRRRGVRLFQESRASPKRLTPRR